MSQEKTRKVPVSTDVTLAGNSDLVPASQKAIKTYIDTRDGELIRKAILTTKGDILTSTGLSTPDRIGVGTDGQVLKADSTTATGLKWGDL